MTHEYIILQGRTPKGVSKKVTEYLADGWELWGNPFTSTTDIGWLFFHQAVVRQVEEDRGRKTEDGEQWTASGVWMAVEPAGYTVQVPETPGEDGKTGDGKTEDGGRRTEDGKTGDRGRETDAPTFEGVPCGCFEIKGDNPDCKVHRGADGPRSGLVY